MWGSMVDFITVDKDKYMIVTFKDGSEIHGHLAEMQGVFLFSDIL